MNISNAPKGRFPKVNSEEEFSHLSCCQIKEEVESILCPSDWVDVIQPREFVEWAHFYHKFSINEDTEKAA